jgi:hypothetical protein
MRRPQDHEGFKTDAPPRNEPDRELHEVQNADYDGKTAEYGYSQAIFDLLKDPVSLGIVGGNNNRGHQR